MVVDESQQIPPGQNIDNMETLPLVVHQVDPQVEIGEKVEAPPTETPEAHPTETPEAPEREEEKHENPDPETPQPPKTSTKPSKSPINRPSRRRQVPRLKRVIDINFIQLKTPASINIVNSYEI